MRISSPAMRAHRDRKGERRALAELALQGEGTPVQLDEPPSEGEAQPRALALARVVGTHLPELLEHRGLILGRDADAGVGYGDLDRSEEHTSELQSRPHLVCRLLLEKKKNHKKHILLSRKKKQKATE